MAVSNVFLKRCPLCGTNLSKDVLRCQCGYVFESNHTQAGLSQTLEDEKLYEDYLTARLKQASQALVEADALHKADPKEPNKAAKVTKALQETEALRKELTAQNAKVAALSKTIQAEQAAKAIDAGRIRLVKEAERAVQKASAAKIKTCPRCRAAAPGDVTRCKCGYVFRDEQLGMPSLTSDQDRPITPERPKRR